jgi:tetratricopeptide (TPR) repeat protein
MSSIHSRSNFVKLLLGLIVFGAGQGASVGCRTLRANLPDSRLVKARQLSLRGADLLRRSRYNDAQTLFDEAIRSCPTDERAHWGIATTHWENGKRTEAIAHMREAVRLSGSNPEFIIRLGEMYLAEGDAAGAAAQAEQVLQGHRDRADAWALLGDSQSRSNQISEAIESYHRALLIQPDYPQVQLSVAELYRRIGRPNRSLATLDRMVDTHPTSCFHGETQLMRALALVDLHRRDEAVLALQSVGQSLPPNKPERHLDLVQAQYQLGELVEARISLGRFKQQFPDHTGADDLQSQLDNSFTYLAEQSTGPKTLR